MIVTERQRIMAWLTENLPKPRLSHVMRVEQMSVELADCHGLNVDKAAAAGLLHDTAKYFKSDRLLAMARAEGLKLDDTFCDNPRLLHADVGAIVARDEFGVTDTDILRAIANHTLGQPNMDGLSCVVFLADGLEPGRGHSSELNQMRQVSYQDLHTAVWMSCDYTIRQLLEAKKPIHPRAIATRNWFLKSAKTS